MIQENVTLSACIHMIFTSTNTQTNEKLCFGFPQGSFKYKDSVKYYGMPQNSNTKDAIRDHAIQ